MTRVLWLLLLVLCGIGSLGGCRGRASLPPGMARTWGSYPAPGGTLTLTITRRDKSLVDYSVANAAPGLPVIFSDHLGSDAMRWFIYWENSTRLWAYGADLAYFKRVDFPPGGAPVATAVKKKDVLPKAVWAALSESVRSDYFLAP